MASTELRVAAQQALEALTSRDGDSWTRRFARDRAIEALEAALAKEALHIDTLRMAREAGFAVEDGGVYTPDAYGPGDVTQLVKRFADLVSAADGAPEERNFCPRCGKRTNDIHTCTPPAPLTDEVIAELWHQNGGFHHHFARAIERWLRGHA